MAEPLALESANGSVKVTLDSLAYIDNLDGGEKSAVEALIDEEMKQMKREHIQPVHYIKHLRPMESFLRFEGRPGLQAEFQRLDSGQKRMAPLDMSRTELPTPRLEQLDDVRAWQAAADNAASQLEHQHNRIANLELAVRNAPVAWRAHNARTEALLKSIDDRLQETASDITKVNQRRKLVQDKAQADLQRLQQKYQDLVRKNVDIEVACMELERGSEVTPMEAERRTHGRA